jgi:hypothetical protein
MGSRIQLKAGRATTPPRPTASQRRFRVRRQEQVAQAGRPVPCVGQTTHEGEIDFRGPDGIRNAGDAEDVAKYNEELRISTLLSRRVWSLGDDYFDFGKC